MDLLTFADCLRAAADQRGLKLRPSGHPEPLAHLDYADERPLKDAALGAFWKQHRLAGEPRSLAAAPRPRGYRTTTKRRAVLRGGLCLAFSGDAEPRPGVAPSELDAPEHLAVYAHLHDTLGRPASASFAEQLNYVIVRGTAGGLCVIFNLREFDAGIVRRAKQLGEAIQTQGLGVRSAFLYLDPSASDYYLEARRPAGVLSFKRLFGPEAIEVRVDAKRLRFPPTVFSQVNEAMLPVMTATARQLLGPLDGRAFIDLYCGYGLFSVCLGSGAASVVGIDAEGPAIEAARENAKHAGLAGRARFLAGRLTGEFLASRLRASSRPESVLLDPPRQGTGPGLVEAVAQRLPAAALHVFCGTDEIPVELERWRRAGYGARTVVPLDLFPGSANLETLVLLRPEAGDRAKRSPRTAILNGA